MLSPNTLLQSRYRIVREIGHGGMGAVYEAIHEELHATVALKEAFRTHDEILRQAFNREARMLACLKHKSLPRVTDCFADGGGLFLVMEYIAGDDLSKQLSDRKQPFPVEEVMQWAEQLLNVLEYLHTRSPPDIHRDIKPHNIKLNGCSDVILLDFGLSKGLAGETVSMRASRSVVGFSPDYSPLEQILKVDDNIVQQLATLDADKVERILKTSTDVYSDIYSLGATLYHLLTNKAPTPSSTRALAIWSGRPDPLLLANDINPQVPSALAALLQKAMALGSEERVARAAAMREALAEIQRQVLQPTELVHDSLPVISSPLPKLGRNSLYYVLSITGVVLLSIIGLLFVVIHSTNTQPSPPPIVADKNQNTNSNTPKFVQPPTVNLEDDQLFPFRKGDKWGFSDVERHLLIEPKYDGVERFSNGMAKVWIEDKSDKKFKYGFINKTGKEVIQVQYDAADTFMEGSTKVKLYGSPRYFDKDGKEIPQPNPTSPRVSFKSAAPTSNSNNLSLQLNDNNKYGFVDSTGKFVIKPMYDDANEFAGRLASVKLGDKWGFIDRSNKFVIKPMYTYASRFLEGLCVVNLDGKYGFIDTNGTSAIPLIYDAAEPFKNGTAKVKI